MIVYIEKFFIAYCGKIRYLFSQHLFAPPLVLILPSPTLHRHLLRAYLARHLFHAPRHIGIFFAPFSPYLPLAAAFRIISPFCCKKNRDFADLTLDKRDSADYLFKRLQFFAGLYYV